MKKYILTLCALVSLSLGMQAQNQMHVNLKDGSMLNVFVSEIESVTWDSSTDDTGENNPDDPTVTGNATNITENSATIVGYANNVRDNESTDLKIGIIYCTEGTPNKSNGIQKTVKQSEVAKDGKYTIDITGLGPGTTYYYRSFVYQSGLWFYGKVRSFNTTGLIFTTGAATSITCFSAKVSATINTPSTVTPSEYGICYGTANNPTDRLRLTSKGSDGSVTATLRALEGNTVYYYRPYAVVNSVISYGPTSSFKTLVDNVVTTGDIDAEGNVRSRLTIGGGAYSTLEVGLCWSRTNAAPTIADNSAKTNELDDENYYVIKPQIGGTIYYRAYVRIDGVAHYGAAKIGTVKMKAGEAVDLGLSVKWASFNIGASSPEDYGWYLAWGETEPKTTYSWDTYFDSVNGSSSNFKKYYDGGGKTTLDPEDDAAHVNWGGDWRMPTLAEQDELRTKCTWRWTSRNGVYGREVTGPNGNSIFLPAAGFRNGGDLYDAGLRGYYWSSSLNTSNSNSACYLYFDSGYVDCYYHYRYYGRSVRAVCP